MHMHVCVYCATEHMHILTCICAQLQATESTEGALTEQHSKVFLSVSHSLCSCYFLNKEALSVAHHRHTHMHTQWQQCVILKGIIWEAGERKVEGGKKKTQNPTPFLHFCHFKAEAKRFRDLEIWMEAENRDEGLEEWKKQAEGWCEFPRET